MTDKEVIYNIPGYVMNKKDFEILVKNEKILSLNVRINDEEILSKESKICVYGVFEEDCIKLYNEGFFVRNTNVETLLHVIKFNEIDYVDLYMQREVGIALMRPVHLVFISRINIYMRDGKKYLFSSKNIKLAKMVEKYLTAYNVKTIDEFHHLDCIDLSLSIMDNYDRLVARTDEFITKD